ncbi:hypothetical protein R1flu_026954 [Riccia fluitans]|uniref:Uncharacterized protein n=1 Tax=Riccia fluitans TaxID=41844 RepID=A0ABD1XKG1_9MARC
MFVGFTLSVVEILGVRSPERGQSDRFRGPDHVAIRQDKGASEGIPYPASPDIRQWGGTLLAPPGFTCTTTSV